MFVQVISGPVGDVDGMKRQFQRWNDELLAGATGFIASTFGVTADGRGIGYAAFESAQAATANSSREQQTAWWNETEKYYTGQVTFHDCDDVETYFSGPTPSSQFVQVMRGTISDRARLKKLEDLMMADMQSMRPDLLGSIRAHYGNGQYYEFLYFSSEAEARAGEAKPLPEEAMSIMNEWQEVSTVDEWFDLTDPWIKTTG